jgi:hypothetical protein
LTSLSGFPDHPSNKKSPWLGYACKRIMDSTNDEVWLAAKIMLKTCAEKTPEVPATGDASVASVGNKVIP